MSVNYYEYEAGSTKRTLPVGKFVFFAAIFLVIPTVIVFLLSH